MMLAKGLQEAMEIMTSFLTELMEPLAERMKTKTSSAGNKRFRNRIILFGS
jgi:hypothetical protein